MSEDYPILMTADMVKSTLANIKKQTRRAIKFNGLIDVKKGNGESWMLKTSGGTTAKKCPFGQIGDRLWVRESFKVLEVDAGYQNEYVIDDFTPALARVEYAADGSIADYELEIDSASGIDQLAQAKRALVNSKHTIPSILMPRWASRITLEITDIRAERLQDINEEDAFYEGLEFFKTGDSYEGDLTYHFKDYLCKGITADDDGEEITYNNTFPDDPVASFKSLWTSIYGAAKWDENPWVWAITFEPAPKGK